MKVEDLKIALQYAKDDHEVMIAIKLPYATAGARPMVAVKSAVSGFDWESGKFIIHPVEELTPADRDFAKQMKDMQEKWGWADYENRGLKAEIRRLKKLLKVEE
jgi:hypothetical protein